jgi:hypothetical protein
MLRSDCAHLKRVTNNDILEKNSGSLRCDVNRAAPDCSTRAGLSCPADCMAYRPGARNGNGNGDSASALDTIKQAFLSLIGK